MLNASRSHLAEVEESYFEHQSVAFRYAGNCLKAAIMAFAHGIVPGWFQTSASDLVKKIANNRKLQA
ncbi:DUF6356 family protein [Candidatus Spongiihabitans sp.]|uniref:DUF6356 family protein n=1 Tax=Candidatus Spongiihabitans sp. TaxID=3101308 RepID=UPI003C701139